MKSGLRDRNNLMSPDGPFCMATSRVSMKSGLRDRNNDPTDMGEAFWAVVVSMKSGLRDRNNGSPREAVLTRDFTKVCERCAPQTPAPPLC